MEEYLYRLDFQVRDYEIDMQGIVNNSVSKEDSTIGVCPNTEIEANPSTKKIKASPRIQVR